MRQTPAWYLPVLACVSLTLAACGDAILATEPELGGPSNTYQLKPLVVDGSDCSDPTWWRDDAGTCWPPDPDNGSDDSPLGGDPGDPGDPSGGGLEEQDDPDPCNTGDALIDAPNVWGGFKDLWEKSLANKIEQGGWIVQEGGSYRLVPFQDATYTPCGIDIYESPPPGTVAMVHTHPWPLFTEDSCGNLNTGTPSEEDLLALQALGLSTGYLLDANGIGKYNATSGETAQRIERCGF